jgi:hypothetical protein
MSGRERPLVKRKADHLEKTCIKNELMPGLLLIPDKQRI